MRLEPITIQGNIPMPIFRYDWRVRLGEKLHPEAITDAWYAADCPPHLDARALPLRIRVQWRIACWLRGAKR